MNRAIIITFKHIVFYVILFWCLDMGDKTDQIWWQAQDDYMSSTGNKKNTSVTSSEALQEQVNCMATALYHEARNQSEEGLYAVSGVILNRAKASGKNVCKIVKERKSGVYQFSYMYLDDKRIKDKKSWIYAQEVARNTLEGNGIAHKAMYFKVCNVESEFFNKLKFMFRKDDHCFYRSRGQV